MWFGIPGSGACVNYSSSSVVLVDGMVSFGLDRTGPELKSMPLERAKSSCSYIRPLTCLSARSINLANFRNSMSMDIASEWLRKCLSAASCKLNETV